MANLRTKMYFFKKNCNATYIIDCSEKKPENIVKHIFNWWVICVNRWRNSKFGKHLYHVLNLSS